VRPIADGGSGLDALWNDDFHHSAMVALTGRAEATTPTRAASRRSSSRRRSTGICSRVSTTIGSKTVAGRPAWDLSPSAFVVFLQNHDQVANTARGLRGDKLTSPGRWRAMTALLLLSPGTPMLFQGQEFAASTPFLYFADFEPELAAAVRKGRGEFLTQFPSVAELAHGMCSPIPATRRPSRSAR
jgi:maltooligosyltrehalose trehalohydrolase